MDKKYISRRKFLKVFTAGSSILAISPLSNFFDLLNNSEFNTSNPYVTKKGKPILVCVEGNDYTRMVKAGIKVIGGLGKLLKNNQDVLINTGLSNAEVYPALKKYSVVSELISSAANLTNGIINVGDENFQVSGQIFYPLIKKRTLIEFLCRGNLVVINYFDVRKLINFGIKQKTDCSVPALNIIKIPTELNPYLNFKHNMMLICGDKTISTFYSVELVRRKFGIKMPLKEKFNIYKRYQNVLQEMPEVKKLKISQLF